MLIVFLTACLPLTAESSIRIAGLDPKPPSVSRSSHAEPLRLLPLALQGKRKFVRAGEARSGNNSGGLKSKPGIRFGFKAGRGRAGSGIRFGFKKGKLGR